MPGSRVTLRHSSTSFTVVTGHEDPDKGGGLDWEAVARLGGTIVVLMGIGRLRAITDRLIAGGLAPDTPAAAIRWGTRAEQCTARATLATLADQPLEPPSTIVIGRVAALDLRWFEDRPLLGRRIVVTRGRAQAGPLASQLRRLGAQPVEVPVIEVVDPADGGEALARAAASVREHDWLVVTSANGARRFLACLRDGRDLAGVRVAAIGPGTADVLREANIEPDLVPERFVAEGLLDAFPEPPAGGGSVLLARAEVARDVLPDGLTAAGWSVEVVDAYRTVPVELRPEQLDAVRGADTVTFTSSSTVAHFVAAVGTEALPPCVASIGPVTSARARSLGLEVDLEAAEHTVDGLVAALLADAEARSGLAT